jgi:lysophospholipase L1-like esterase
MIFPNTLKKLNDFMKNYTYLALGDSYTIGEGVELCKSFPYQTIQLLRGQHLSFAAPEIIAKTGWTTAELMNAIEQFHYLSEYDFVSLLIGVNNQYRGQPPALYESELEQLLVKSISFTGGKNNRVFILSIPDYGKTPFGKKLDPAKIEKEISEFNSLNKKLAQQYHTNYINITSDGNAYYDNEFVAADGLHPSEIEYRRWAEKLKIEMRKSMD